MATETAGTKFGDDGLESSRSEAAQQLSASAWLTIAVESEPGTARLCIGQAAPSTQQAIRASGVACHPAHSAQLPAVMVSTATNAIARVRTCFTILGCSSLMNVSNP